MSGNQLNNFISQYNYGILNTTKLNYVHAGFYINFFHYRISKSLSNIPIIEIPRFILTGIRRL